MPSKDAPPLPVSNPTAPPEHGPTVTFMRSSQARNWRFSAKQIGELRLQGNEAACQRLQDVWAKERSLSPVEGEPISSSSSDPIIFTTIDEEQALIRYYLTRVHQLVKAFGLPEGVEATAITFIKRFYLRNTCMDYHPKNIMLTCLFLAAKAESNPIPLKHFSTKLAGKEASSSAIQEYSDTVQRLEFLVSQSLNFQFMVHGAHRGLHGLLLDVQQTLQPTPDSTAIRSLIEPARNHIKQSRFTDAELIYTPSQITMACLGLSSNAGQDMVTRYIEAKKGRAKEAKLKAKEERQIWREKKSKGATQEAEEIGNKSTSQAELSDEKIEQEPLGISQSILEGVLNEIKRLVEEKARTANEDVEQVKSIDKKLKLCQNPENLPTSRIFHFKGKEKDEALLGKRKSVQAAKEEAHLYKDDDDEGVDSAAAGQGSTKKIKLQQ